MAKKRKRTLSDPMVPYPRRKARGERSRGRTRRGDGAAMVQFNKRGELVITDPRLVAELDKRIKSGRLIIRRWVPRVPPPMPPPEPVPPPPMNMMCGCAGYQLELVRRLESTEPLSRPSR